MTHFEIFTLFLFLVIHTTRAIIWSKKISNQARHKLNLWKGKFIKIVLVWLQVPTKKHCFIPVFVDYCCEIPILVRTRRCWAHTCWWCWAARLVCTASSEVRFGAVQLVSGKIGKTDFLVSQFTKSGRVKKVGKSEFFHDVSWRLNTG